MTEREKRGPGRPRSLESEKAILDSTMALLASEGYGGFTVDKVAQQARVSKATIYRRWPSKEHLVIAAFDERTPPLTVPNKGKLADDLLDAALQFVRIVRTTPLSSVLPALMGERARNRALSEALDPWIERRRGPIKQIVQSAIDRGELPKGIDLDLAEDVVMGPVLMRLFFTPKSDLSRAALRQLVGVVMRGLGAAG